MTNNTYMRIRMDAETIEALKKLAYEDRRTLSNYVKMVIHKEVSEVSDK